MNRTITVATGTGVYRVEVVREDTLAVRVACQADGCTRVIDQPNTRAGISPRGCIDHPPHTWKKD